MIRLRQLIQGLPITIADNAGNPEIRGVACDSRRVNRGGLFFAIPGFEKDGIDFLPEAIANGAAAVICSSRVGIDRADLVVATCRQPRMQMAEISSRFFRHPSTKLQVLAVTGTNGKTTVASLIQQWMSLCGRPWGNIGTLHYQLLDEIEPAARTTPESCDLQQMLFRLVTKGAEGCVIEASSHGLALKRFEGIYCKAAVFTNLSRDHLDFHRSMDVYLKAKISLFENLPRQSWAILNGDDPASQQIAASTPANIEWFGENSRSQNRLIGFRNDFQGSTLEIETATGQAKIDSPLTGRFNAWNILAAFVACRICGVPEPQLIETAGRLRPPPGRFELLAGPKGKRIIVDYAHTPEGLRQLLRSARALRPRRLIVVFGCGGDRDPGKRPLMGAAAAEWADRIWVTSDNPRSEDPDKIIAQIMTGIGNAENAKIRVEIDRRQAIEQAFEAAGADDLLVIAGKGHETHQIIGDQILHFSDQEIVRSLGS